MKSPKGTFTISLDFELFWGMHDHSTYAEYETRLLTTRLTIPRILELFERYGIHATWATVGILFNDPCQEIVTELPSVTPSYHNIHLSPYRQGTWPILGETEKTQPGKFAASLIKLISDSEGQEIGSHTYSHYCCLENGQNLDQFKLDLMQAIQIAERSGYKLRSFVFPRNQYTQEHIAVASELGFTAIRVQDKSWLYQPRQRNAEGYMCRFFRGIDSFLPITGSNINDVASPPKNNAAAQLPTSRFLRPWKPSLAIVDHLQIRRIMRSMTQAAQSNKNFHLWWHPHNFGSHTDKNLARLDQILNHYAALEAEFGYESRNMSELADLCYSDDNVPQTSSSPAVHGR